MGKEIYTIQEALAAFTETVEFAEKDGLMCGCSRDIFHDRLMKKYPMEKSMSNRQIIHHGDRIGLFINPASEKLFYGVSRGVESNLIIPEKVILDDDGLIQAVVDRRNLKFKNT